MKAWVFLIFFGKQKMGRGGGGGGASNVAPLTRHVGMAMG